MGPILAPSNDERDPTTVGSTATLNAKNLLNAHSGLGLPVSRIFLAVLALATALLSIQGNGNASSPPDIVMWGHPGCPHCRAAHAFLGELRARRPDLVIVEHDVTEDQAAFDELRARSHRAKLDMVGLPSFLVRGSFLVGFDSAATTGRRIEALVPPPSSRAPPDRATAAAPSATKPRTQKATRPPAASEQVPPPPVPSAIPPDSTPALDPESEKAPPPSEPAAPVPEHARAHAPGAETLRVPVTTPPPGEGDGAVELPFFGRVSEKTLGLPAFTIAVGLVDGFNPCAMWVLMFLLALLVNVKSRARMLAIAGTFVVVSGLAYFAFMAAWLNVFYLIGLSRAVQVVLGITALVVALVNIKDFFAFGKAISLSIPEKAKPGIYARVRAIVRAETLWAALAGATVLAVLVNVIELVCTAGLPALYTQVLVQQGVSTGARYGYLALYNLAYMFDDSIMVGIAVVTLGRRKLQERGGRWLKLLSGLVILLLGLLLLFAPEALVW